MRKTFKDYAPGFVHVDIKYLQQMADQTARRYRFVGIDRATRWAYPRIARGHPVYADQSQVSRTHFLRRLHTAAPMKTGWPWAIEKLLTDNGRQFTDRFTTGGGLASKTKERTGKHAFDRECALLKIEHRLIKPRHPQTTGMLERFNRGISDILATTHFRSRGDRVASGHLQTTTDRYQTRYNDHLPQKAVGHVTPLNAMRIWQSKRPELCIKKPKNQAVLDTHHALAWTIVFSSVAEHQQKNPSDGTAQMDTRSF